MKERPILFSTPMVRALLAGTKTQTRRVVALGKLTPLSEFACCGERRFAWCDKVGEGEAADERNFLALCKFGESGDRLWVRETWARDEEDGSVLYRADDNADTQNWDQQRQESGLAKYNWRPSIYMPRWARRITLEITAVRAERLHCISEADAVAEGAAWGACGGPQIGSHRAGYAALWEQINGPGSWDANPWVWVIEFERRDFADQITPVIAGQLPVALPEPRP